MELVQNDLILESPDFFNSGRTNTEAARASLHLLNGEGRTQKPKQDTPYWARRTDNGKCALFFALITGANQEPESLCKLQKQETKARLRTDSPEMKPAFRGLPLTHIDCTLRTNPLVLGNWDQLPVQGKPSMYRLKKPTPDFERQTQTTPIYLFVFVTSLDRLTCSGGYRSSGTARL